MAFLGSGCGGAALVAPALALPGTQTASQINNAPIINSTADEQTRYSQQIIDNRNDIYINQPVINNRDHYINNINTQVIRDNNFYHYQQQNFVRDNYINRYYNQVVRQQNNYSTFSQTWGVLPGTVSNFYGGSSYYNLGASCNGYASGYGLW